MSALILSGCRTTPLSGYLAALGIHRAITRLLDPAALGVWRSGTYVIDSLFSSTDDLAAALEARFCPESVVSPWNSGSGFAANGKSTSAEAVLQWVRDSTDDRLNALKMAVTAADGVIVAARESGIEHPLDKQQKSDILALCRGRLPDAAVAWLDAAIALGQGDPSYSRLLGTGGNLGRQDLSATYLQQVRTVFEHRNSAEWLAAALDGRPRVALPKATPGQYDPGGVGEAEEPNVGNPWTFVFVIEGTLLFATKMVRRHGAEYANAALPFQVAASAAGFTSAASGERPLAELWAPEWRNPMRIAEIEHLLSEGRADWNSRPARSGLDMSRAAATIGVDRGISAFQRHVFVERLGQNPIAVPTNRIAVGFRGGVDLLAPLDNWRGRVRTAEPPAEVDARLRDLDQALFDHASAASPQSLARVFAALGRCRSAVTRSGAVRDKAGNPHLDAGDKFLAHLEPALENDRELRIALALATSRDRDKPFANWLTAPTATGRLAERLADIARRRGFPRATSEPVIDRTPSVRGARIAFERGIRLCTSDILAFVEQTVDEDRITSLLYGLSCIDWKPADDRTLPGARTHDPALALLLLFTNPKTLNYTDTNGEPRSLFVRPGHNWVSSLTAKHTDRVLADASRRLRIAGLRHVIGAATTELDGTRLAAALLMTPSRSDLYHALTRVAVIGKHRTTPSQEAIA